MSEKFKGIDNPKIVFPVIGLLGLTGLARIAGIPGTGYLAGLFAGILVSFIFRHALEVKHE
ncbi:MAG: hypothetical protein RE471_02885 [Ferroplasma sp.]|uniref:hypothetical protein n=1 Tax=Ferroplasma sp. TaxID=2591003 RepID=UPI002814CC98|nr:hypothetical protein [Ferroplasma sp.]WMT51832.1 MAG: hypothetical protein RE471_02885 [Ferroplasma sp.]